MRFWGALVIFAVLLALLHAERLKRTEATVLMLSPGFNHTIVPIGIVKDANNVEIKDPELGDIVLHNLREIHMVLDMLCYVLIFAVIVGLIYWLK
jgi:hypothetical protein